MRIKSIGVVHTPFKSKNETPIQPCKSKAIGRVEVCKEYQDGLCDIDGFSHLILIYKFHRSKGYSLKVRPFLDARQRGVFATRYPRRPNQIGLTVVKFLRKKGNVVFVKGIDVIDGTPLLDIKPYVPDFSPTENVKIGWLKEKIL